MSRLFLFFLILPAAELLAQGVDIPASNGTSLEESWQQRTDQNESSWLKSYPVRNVGPVVQGGRITDITVVDPTHYYIAFASGGVFETRDRGITFQPVFDNAGALGIGDIAHAPSNPDILYIGTGENNSSRSSYAGSGIYRSNDKGASWNYLGLANSQHIGRIIVHPENPDIVWVASMGALYSHNSERGVYKSVDGGKSWSKTLFINDSTGIIDLIINPVNPRQLWASSWERTRKAWNFKGSGKGSAIYRSDDGGDTWTKITVGFPEGEQVGRIGLAVSHQNPSIVYAFLDNLAEVRKDKPSTESDGLRIKDFMDMTSQHLLTMDNELLDKFLKNEGFPEKYTAEQIKNDIRDGKYTPRDIATYFGDANSALFETDVIGAELYRSEDSGNTWMKMNSYDLPGVNFTYGYYFGEVRVDPNDDNKLYILGVPLLKTTDGGKTYARIDTLGDVHVDHQAMWIDPENSRHILLGNDGGLYETYDEGANWHHINNMPVGQFYTINYDMQKPYHIYGGLQDNGTLSGSSRSVPNRSEDWDMLFGGDGMFVAPDPRNHNVVYAGFQFGNYYKINRKEGKREYITPKKEIGEAPLRFNWRTPLIMSSHNPDILYIGAQKVYRSLDQGKNWKPISEDLTFNYPQGNVPFSTISSIAESPMHFGELYLGTDDGRVHYTNAAGGSWEEITSNLPKNLWVSSIHPSSHNNAVVYISLNGYRADNFNTYIFRSEDKGKTWTSIKGNLPEVVINVIVEDPVNENLLYTGTDHGTYISFNRGDEWHLLPGALNVAAYDIKIHPRDHEIIIGTHGRSVFVADVKPLQKLAADGAGSILAFEPSEVRHSKSWGEKRYPYLNANTPTAEVQFFTDTAGEILVEIYNENYEMIRKETIDAERGFNTYRWDLKGGKFRKKAQEPLSYITPAKYKIEFKKGGSMSAVFVTVK